MKIGMIVRVPLADWGALVDGEILARLRAHPELSAMDLSDDPDEPAEIAERLCDVLHNVLVLKLRGVGRVVLEGGAYRQYALDGAYAGAVHVGDTLCAAGR